MIFFIIIMSGVSVSSSKLERSKLGQPQPAHRLSHQQRREWGWSGNLEQYLGIHLTTGTNKTPRAVKRLLSSRSLGWLETVQGPLGIWKISMIYIQYLASRGTPARLAFIDCPKHHGQFLATSEGLRKFRGSSSDHWAPKDTQARK